MNQFYIYYEYFDSLNGAEFSTIEYSEPFSSFEDIYEEWKQDIEFEKELCQNTEWITCHVYEDMLCADFLRDEFIGEGWRIGIVEK